MTVVSLQLASSSFGPRLLRTFLRDRGNQLVLGTFLGTFLYCIVVLPTIDTTADPAGDEIVVPRVAVAIAVLLSVASLAMLVYYIDHVAQSIHADAVVYSVGQELDREVEQLFPGDVGADAPDASDRGAGAPRVEGEPARITARQSGYVRFMNGDSLLALAVRHDLFVRVHLRPGTFASHGECLVEAWPADRVDDAVAQDIVSTFLVGAHRTTLQDLLFTFEQVSEIAMRAMSPSINDPTTAVHCVDRIGSGLARFVCREAPSRWRADADDVVRLRIDPIELPEILEATVVAVSRTSGVHLPVWLRLVGALEIAARRAARPADWEALAGCARQLAEHGDGELASEADRRRLREAAAWATEAA